MTCDSCLQPMDENDTMYMGRGYMGKPLYYHVGGCPRIQFKVDYRVRVFCTADKHTECSVVQSPTNAAPYYIVCACLCHMKGR